MGNTSSSTSSPTKCRCAATEKELFDAKLKIVELEKQVESLKQIVNAKSIPTPETISRSIYNNEANATLEEKNIDDLVDKIISNPKYNISYLPDFVEKQLYKNMFSMMFHLIDHMCESTEIGLLGNTLKLSISPNQEIIGNPNNNINKN